MKAGFLVLHILVLCLVNVVQAQNNIENAQVKLPETSTVATQPADHRLYKGLNIFVNGGASVMSNTIEGVGMNSKMPSTFGSNYGGEINYGLSDSNTNVYFRHSISSVRYEDVAGATPSSFNQKNARTDVGFNIGLVNGTDNGIPTFGLGYYYAERSSDRVSPAVIAASYIAGPTVSLGYTNTLSSKTFYESGITIGFSNYFQESNTVTGRYKFGISSILNLKVAYVYTENVDLAVGIQINYDSVSFSGSGTGAESRGISDASEQFVNYMVPFELRLKL